MSLRDALLGATAPFAHLNPAKLAAAAARKAKEADDDAKRAEDEEDAKAKAEDGGDDEDMKAKADASDDEGDDEDDEDDEGDDDSDEEEASGKRGKKAAAARRRERARCAAIFADKAAAGNVALAAELAFHTALPRSRALAILKTAPAGRGGLAARMAEQPLPAVSPDGGGSPSAGKPNARAVADNIIRLYREARGIKA